MFFLMKLRNRLSLFTIVLILGIYLFSIHKFAKWHDAIIGGGDTWGYYLYLPATFIHHDLGTLEASVKARRQYHPAFSDTPYNPLGVDETHIAWSGKQVNKYTTGVAILYSPFFFIAHAIALAADLPANGYSFIYIYLIHLSSIFYAIIGFIFLRKVLLRFFTDQVTSITLLLIALATNLYYFTVYNSPMAHAYLFSLYCMLLYATIKWYESKSWKAAIGIGLTAGFITLIRPTEIICLFIPLFWGLSGFRDIPERVAMFGKEYKKLLLAVFVFVLVAVPQLLYWKYTAGEFIYYSYGDESFDFLHPHIKDGLWSYKNGWLAYTPVMYLALIGILFLFRNRQALFPVVLFLPLHIYIIYSWWCWNYINGMGSRPMVEAYALLSLPLAYTIRFVWKKKALLILTLPICLFFIWLNIFNTYQLYKGVLWSEEGNWPYYKGIFGKTKLTYNDLVRFDFAEEQPEENELSKIATLHSDGFEKPLTEQYTTAEKYEGQYSYILNNAVTYGPTFSKTMQECNIKTGDWLKLSVYCKVKQNISNFYRMRTFAVSFERGDKNLKFKAAKIDNKPGNPTLSLWGGESNVWGEVKYWVQVPNNVLPSDVIKAFTWNPEASEIYIDNFKIELYRK
jgi:hypothetical protein